MITLTIEEARCISKVTVVAAAPDIVVSASQNQLACWDLTAIKKNKTQFATVEHAKPP